MFNQNIVCTTRVCVYLVMRIHLKSDLDFRMSCILSVLPSGNVSYTVSGNYDVQTHFKCTFLRLLWIKQFCCSPNFHFHFHFHFFLVWLFQALWYVCGCFFPSNFCGLSYNVFRLFQMIQIQHINAIVNRYEANIYFVCDFFLKKVAKYR